MALVSATLRHLSDARTLLTSSPVQAMYLAGYGPECIRKAALMRLPEEDEDQRNRTIGHRFGKPEELALRLFCDGDLLASRYGLTGWKKKENALGDWKEDLRYSRSDSVTSRQATKLVEASEKLAMRTLTDLWCDGRLEPLGSLTRTS
jgi:hypothetical protein